MPLAPRFLVVDDVSTMRRIVIGLLKEAGYRDVAEAEDGESALERLRAERFDFVITDLHMPRMDGMQLLETLKQDPELAAIPVLILTADARKEDILQAARLGAAGFVVKPFTRAILENRVLMILRKQGR